MTKSITLMKTPFRSLRHFLVVFVLVVVLPGLLFGLLLASWSAQRLVEGREQEADRMVAAAAEGMATHLRTMTTGIAVLANMPLDEAHFAAFYQVAKGFAVEAGYQVTLADADGNQFFTTRLPFGSKMPRRSAMDSVRQAVASGQPHVSDLFVGKLVGHHIITVDAPVRTASGLRIVTLTSEPGPIADVLFRTNVPEGWLLGLIDGKGNFIAHSKNPEKWIGKPARPDLIAATRKSESGSLYARSVEGFPVVDVFQRVPGSNWTVLIGIPEPVLFAPLIRPVGLLVALLVVVVVMTLALARRFTEQLNAASRSLTEVARDPFGVAFQEPNPFIEFEEVAKVVRTAAGRAPAAGDGSRSAAGNHPRYGWPHSSLDDGVRAAVWLDTCRSGRPHQSRVVANGIAGAAGQHRSELAAGRRMERRTLPYA